MTNVVLTWLANEQSIELFVHHWMTGKNYEDSTVLVDCKKNIIWFYDNWTEDIEIVQTEVPFEWWFIIVNWKVIRNFPTLIRYETWDYHNIKERYNEEVIRVAKEKDGEDIGDVSERMFSEMRERNRLYFKQLIKKYEIRID